MAYKIPKTVTKWSKFQRFLLHLWCHTCWQLVLCPQSKYKIQQSHSHNAMVTASFPVCFIVQRSDYQVVLRRWIRCISLYLGSWPNNLPSTPQYKNRKFLLRCRTTTSSRQVVHDLTVKVAWTFNLHYNLSIYHILHRTWLHSENRHFWSYTHSHRFLLSVFVRKTWQHGTLPKVSLIFSCSDAINFLTQVFSSLQLQTHMYKGCKHNNVFFSQR